MLNYSIWMFQVDSAVYWKDLQVGENRTESGMLCWLTEERKALWMHGFAGSWTAFTHQYSLHNKSNCGIIKWYEVIHWFLEAYLLLLSRRPVRSINQRSSKISLVVQYLFFKKIPCSRVSVKKVLGCFVVPLICISVCLMELSLLELAQETAKTKLWAWLL